MRYTHVLIHYSEIAIKKGNRSTFEGILLKNIREATAKLLAKTYKRFGRVVCLLDENSDIEKLKGILEKTPGISGFSFCLVSSQSIDDIKATALALAKSFSFESFRISAKRSYKGYRYNSQEIGKIVGEIVFETLKKKVCLKHPDLDINIEVTEKEVFVYSNRDTFAGIGGLPVSSTGTVLCSLSGGIDSPVSGYMLNKRGCKVIYVHIQNNSLVTREVEGKIFRLCELLKSYQGKTKLYIVQFSEIQSQLLIAVPADYRMIIYRRFMLKILERIAYLENSKGIVTGDSIGQVASQTLENLQCIYEASSLPVYSPLIGLNKEEIISISKKIGTYQISILQYPDCCSFMISEHPKTKGKLDEVKAIEENIKSADSLIELAVSKARVYYF